MMPRNGTVDATPCDHPRAIRDRLGELRDEFRRGQEQLDLLDRKRAEVRDVLLRISGAIQVLEGLLTDHRDDSPQDAPGLA